ncbi:hypothetical protein CC85DRAFT_127157 [Cutaneotrichosporon oleaginosum]|uniref:Uncharacterized protein n=1 Tax=Cutaneotrichosporon oleaginosum TaxID=879819 RepID=A0A0J0XJC1_9TREE|nr:uncharacterized protein CC85DRAFT_127157 [Cutaneotrichosporon oleaginosum]KLT41156.1 hypothetical protein CC85DRAFT_127157 [Cutaneotrichosporon oleaginosum]
MPIHRIPDAVPAAPLLPCPCMTSPSLSPISSPKSSAESGSLSSAFTLHIFPITRRPRRCHPPLRTTPHYTTLAAWPTRVRRSFGGTPAPRHPAREPGAGGAHWQVPVVFGTSAQSFWVRLGRIANLPRLEARGVDGKLVGAWKMEGGRWCGSGRGVRQWFQRVGNRHRFRRRWSRYQLGPSTSTGALMWRWKGDEVVTDGSGVDEEVDIYIGEGEWMNAESKTGVDVGRWLGRWEPSGVLCESAKWMNA